MSDRIHLREREIVHKCPECGRSYGQMLGVTNDVHDRDIVPTTDTIIICRSCGRVAQFNADGSMRVADPNWRDKIPASHVAAAEKLFRTQVH